MSKPTCLRWVSFNNWNYISLYCDVTSQVYSNIRHHTLSVLNWRNHAEYVRSLPHRISLKVSVQKLSSEIILLPNINFRITLTENTYLYPWMGIKSLQTSLKISILEKELCSSILFLRYTQDNHSWRKATLVNRRLDVTWYISKVYRSWLRS